jgi:hypothetical protein
MWSCTRSGRRLECDRAAVWEYLVAVALGAIAGVFLGLVAGLFGNTLGEAIRVYRMKPDSRDNGSGDEA